MPEPIELLTPAETAALLGLRPGTLEIWRCTKKWPLNFIKIGGRVRYRRQDVEKFLEARTVVCGPQASTRVRRKRCA